MFKNGFFLISFALLSLTAASCTTVKQIARIEPRKPDVAEMCANIDWFEAGLSDGRLGYPLSRLDEQRRRCNSTPHPVDIELFTNGRNLGLTQFCTYDGGLEAGRLALTYERVCPTYLEDDFLTGYDRGSQIHALEAENAELDGRITNLLGLLSPTRPTGAVNGQIEVLKSRRAQNQLQIDNLEEQASAH